MYIVCACIFVLLLSLYILICFDISPAGLYELNVNFVLLFIALCVGFSFGFHWIFFSPSIVCTTFLYAQVFLLVCFEYFVSIVIISFFLISCVYFAFCFHCIYIFFISCVYFAFGGIIVNKIERNIDYGIGVKFMFFRSSSVSFALGVY